MHGPSTIESAVNRLSSVVTGALNQAIPFNCTKKFKFPGRFSSNCKYYINKRPHYKTDACYAAFSRLRKFVKITIKFGRKRWLKSS
jgi:hypothetical protein